MKTVTNQYVVTGIGTGVGKTFISAVLVAGLGASYYKPVQAGYEPESDADFIKRVLGWPNEKILLETYKLSRPESPHSAAAAEGITIDEQRLLILPNLTTDLVVEGAGGVFVPLNDRFCYIDLFAAWQVPVIVVSDLYLGAINHTILTIKALEAKRVPIRGVIYNQTYKPTAAQAIQNLTGVNVLGIIPFIENPTFTDFKLLFEKFIKL